MVNFGFGGKEMSVDTDADGYVKIQWREPTTGEYLEKSIGTLSPFAPLGVSAIDVNGHWCLPHDPNAWELHVTGRDENTNRKWILYAQGDWNFGYKQISGPA